MPRLLAASINRRPSDVVFEWEVDGDLEAASSPWLLSFDLIGGDDGPIHQFGFRFRDGEVAERFYFDFVDAQNYYAPEVAPERVGDTWTAIFPAGDEVARSGKWQAALSFDQPDNSNETNVEGTF